MPCVSIILLYNYLLERILIIQTAFIGDVILATPLIEKLKRFFPDAKIDFLLRNGNESLFINHPKLNEVLIWNKKEGKYNNLARISRRVRANKYDLLINLQRFASSGLISSSSKAKIKLGFEKNPFAFTFTKKFPHVISAGVHEVDRNLKLIEHLTDSAFQAPVLYPNQKDFDRVSPLKAVPYICIAPTSVWFTKQYPPEKWVELLNALPPDMKVYLLGAEEDVEVCDRIKFLSSHDEIEILAGKLSLLQSAALMKDAQMNYVNDSAPMHLASAVNAPITAIYCSTVKEFGFGPLSINSKVVNTELKLKCKPCGLHGKKACPLGHFKCALTIKTEQLL